MENHQQANQQHEGTEFPKFSDGDVLIVISGSRQYQLHRTVLQSQSSLFYDLLHSLKATEFSEEAIKDGLVIRWRLDTINNANGRIDKEQPHIEILKRVRLDREGRACKPIPLDLENGLLPDPIHLAYDAVLGVLYGIPIRIPTFEEDSLDDLMAHIDCIVVVAEHLDLVQIVTVQLEMIIFKKGQRVYKAIYDSPIVWLQFAVRLRSTLLYKEAFLHVVGKFHTPEVQHALNDGAFSDRLCSLIEMKAQGLKDRLMHAQRLMSSHYPDEVKRFRTTGLAEIDNIGRQGFEKNIFQWVAISIFRQHIGEQASLDRTHNAMDMGYKFMETISKGGNAYITSDDLDEFNNTTCAQTDRGRLVMENHLLALKQAVRPLAQKFFENKALLDVRVHQVEYFTCVDVRAADVVFFG